MEILNLHININILIIIVLDTHTGNKIVILTVLLNTEKQFLPLDQINLFQLT